MKKDIIPIISSLNSEKKIENGKIIYPEKKLLELLRAGVLTNNLIEEEAKKIKMDAHRLCLLIFAEGDLMGDYIQYKNEKEKTLDKKEIISSFLEKIRSKSEITDEESKNYGRDNINETTDKLLMSFNEGSFSLDEIKEQAKDLNIEAFQILRNLMFRLCETDNQFPIRLANLFDQELDNKANNKLTEIIKGIFSIKASGSLLEIIKNNIDLSEDRVARGIVGGMLAAAYVGTPESEERISSLLLKVERSVVREKAMGTEIQISNKLKEIKDENYSQNKVILEKELNELMIKKDNIYDKLSDLAYQIYSVTFGKNGKQKNSFLNLSSEEREKLIKKQRVVEKELTQLLDNNKLKNEKIAEAAADLGISVIELSIRVIGRAQKDDLFENETRQKIKTQPKGEKEISSVEVPEVKVEPATPKSVEALPVPQVETPDETLQVSAKPESEPQVETFPKPEMKNWWEVKRETEVMAVEDLDGDMRKFEEHVTKLGVAKKDSKGHWQWTGGDKKLVLLGDVLGDRRMDGVEISLTIGDIAKQAERKKGGVDFLCGNHDIALINFLCSPEIIINEKRAKRLSDQYEGIWELAQFDSDPNSELKRVVPSSAEFRERQEELWNKLFKKTPEILEAMRNKPRGRNFLENLCKIKIAVVHDDTLFCHTDPTTSMITDLTKNGNISQKVAEINQIFQKNLNEVLFDSAKFSDEFSQIERTYLYTDNRSYFVEDEESRYKSLATDLLKIVIKNFIRNDGIDEYPFAWKDYIFAAHQHISLDKQIIIRSIEKWKKENKLEGEYLADVIDILKAFKAQDRKKVDIIEKKIIDKIENFNKKIDYVRNVRSAGINTIIHGHSPLSDRFYSKNDFVIASPHGSYSGAANGESGVCTIQKNGKIEFIGKSFRDKR